MTCQVPKLREGSLLAASASHVPSFELYVVRNLTTIWLRVDVVTWPAQTLIFDHTRLSTTRRSLTGAGVGVLVGNAGVGVGVGSGVGVSVGVGVGDGVGIAVGSRVSSGVGIGVEVASAPQATARRARRVKKNPRAGRLTKLALRIIAPSLTVAVTTSW